MLFDKLGQSRSGLKLDLVRAGRGGVFGTPPLVVDAPSILGAPSRQHPCAWLARWRRLTASSTVLDGVALPERLSAKHGVAASGNRSCYATVLQSDLFAALAAERYDLIVSNPLYVPARHMGTLSAEHCYEPALGLDGGPDGLAVITRILEDASHHLTLRRGEDGVFLIEADALHQHFDHGGSHGLTLAKGTTARG